MTEAIVDVETAREHGEAASGEALRASPKRFINRELSWLEFNRRVLLEAANASHPLLERVRFVSISANNLDEFFMVRVAGICGQVRSGVETLSDDGLLPEEQLPLINARVSELADTQVGLWRQLEELLKAEHVFFVDPAALKKAERIWLDDHFFHPYDPASNPVYQRPPYRLLDLSYYKGKFYLYWGITPALILFWPYIVLTGHYLFHRQAVAMFCGMGFLVNVGLLCALWRRYFAEVSIVVVAACVLALGLATGIPALLSQCDVYEVPIGCGYMLTALALGAIWRALHEPERKGWWLAAASLAYGLAVGARPSLLFGALILLVPVAQAWRERRPIWAALMAATIPITLVGLGLMLYNVLRFD
ncbi:MAG: hypothetical protein ACLPG2_07455, partial [Rhodoblastus sp.]